MAFCKQTELQIKIYTHEEIFHLGFFFFYTQQERNDQNDVCSSETAAKEMPVLVSGGGVILSQFLSLYIYIIVQ